MNPPDDLLASLLRPEGLSRFQAEVDKELRELIRLESLNGKERPEFEYLPDHVLYSIDRKYPKLRKKKGRKGKRRTQKTPMVVDIAGLPAKSLVEEMIVYLQEGKRVVIDSKQISLQQAKDLVTRKDIRKYLCPALQTVANDAFEISKVITPILVGLVIAGTIVIPLIPVLIASMALVIARMGISGLCADFIQEDASKK